MLQYVLNASIIWLVCLVLYELLLRRESFHQHNRIYLLASLAAGLILPLISLKPIVPAVTSSFSAPVQQIYAAKQTLQPVTGTPTPLPAMAPEAAPAAQTAQIDMELILWSIYLAGILIAVLFVVKEALQLIRLYAGGSKARQEGCVIVETGKDHCPFSFFHIVFVKSRAEYNHDQWAILVAHERAHSMQLHSLDNLLLIAVRILLWFHPLPHMYYTRLRLLHEFQADDAATTNTLDYGTFLLEQNMLQRPPILAHAINYSPLKTRIAMLTRTKSARTKLVKYAAAIPVLVILALFCTKTSISGEMNRKENVVYFKGNEIEFRGLQVVPHEFRRTQEQQQAMMIYYSLPDSVPVKEPRTGRTIHLPVLRDTVPIALNGKPVLGNEPQYHLTDKTGKFTYPKVNNSGALMHEYLFAELKYELDKLENGEYTLQVRNIVVDDQGTIVYYEHKGLDVYNPPGYKKTVISKETQAIINEKIVAAMNASVKFKPATLNGKAVHSRVPIDGYQVIVKDHKAQLAVRGC